MPNISFDIFFDKDFLNVSASRGRVAPKAKPEWKVRSAPKLPPKEIPTDPVSTPRPAQREKITASRRPPPKLTKPSQDKGEEKPETSDAASQTGDAPRRKPPKLGPKKSTANGVSKEADQSTE